MSDKQPIVGKEGEILVFIISHDAVCADCGETLAGGMIRPHGEGVLCMDCADLGHLEFLPRGNTAVTRRAGKHSKLKAIVLKWSRRRKRYERQGILAEAEAIDRAERECEADAPERQRRQEREAQRREKLDTVFIDQFAAAVRKMFPGCPAGDEKQIAGHACEKHSGRVGRSAAAKELDDRAVRLAVIAHIRHVHTKYDDYLLRGIGRDEARDMIRREIDRVLERWERAR